MTDAPIVLVVEDNYLAGQGLVRLLGALGVSAAGPAPTAQDGLELAEKHQLDGAILDINVRDGSTAALADHLLAQQCPVLFVTGYRSPSSLPAHLQACPRLVKPVGAEALAHALQKFLRVPLAHA